MRIGLMSDTFLPVVDGVGRVVVSYAETLAGMSHQVTVSAPAYDTGHRGGYSFELVDYYGVRVPTYPQYRTGSPSMDRHYKRRIDMIPLDIVHAHSPFAAGAEGLRLSRQRGIPLVSTFHSKYYDDFLKVTKSETIAKAVLSKIVSFYKKCDEVWALSESSGQVLREYGYFGPSRVVTNGTALRETSEEAITSAEDNYGLGNLPVFLYAGQMNWKKNILRILEAAKLVREEIPDFKLVLAGFGQDESAIRQKIEEFGLEGQTIMTGMISDTARLDALYARARLFLFPSLYDTFSMVIREAAAMGTPSVAVAGSCAAESIRDGGNGFFCQDEAGSLAGVMKRALASPDEMKRVGEAARVEIPVTWEVVMKNVVEQYENLIQNHLGIHSSQRRYQRKHPD
jgi:1,2-diacylglycerol 3-alpha-glucosyltransferase